MGAFETMVLSEDTGETGEVDEQLNEETAIEAEETSEEGGEGDSQEIGEILGETSEEGSEEEGEPEKEEGLSQEDLQKPYKVKIRGEEYNVPLQNLIDSYSHAQAANEKFRQAATLQKQAQNMVNQLKSDPITTLEQLGVDFKDAATQWLSDRIEYEMKPEHEKQNHDYKLQIKRLQEEKDQREENERRQKETAERETLKKQYISDISSAIDSVGGMPKNEQIISAIARKAEALMRAGYNDVPMDRIAAAVKKEYEGNLRTVLDGMSDEQRMEFVGKHAKKISNNYASKYSKNVLKAPKAKAKATPTEKKMTFREMMESGDF